MSRGFDPFDHWTSRTARAGRRGGRYAKPGLIQPGTGVNWLLLCVLVGLLLAWFVLVVAVLRVYA